MSLTSPHPSTYYGTQSNGGMAQATCAASLLTIKGTAEQALNAPPDARDGVTFYRRSFKKIPKTVRETFETEYVNLAAEQFCGVELPRIGDICTQMWLKVSLPGLVSYINTGTTALDGVDAGSGSSTGIFEVLPAALSYDSVAYSSGTGQCVRDPDNYKPVPFAKVARWCRYAPFVLCKKIELQVGNSTIETLTSEILQLWYSMKPSLGRTQLHHLAMDTTQAQIIASMTARICYVELPFSFFLADESSGLDAAPGSNGLSLVTLSFHSVKVGVTPRQIDDLITAYAPGTTAVQWTDTNSMAHTITTAIRPNETIKSLANFTGRSNGHVYRCVATSVASEFTLVSDVAQIAVQLAYECAFLGEYERQVYAEASWETMVFSAARTTVTLRSSDVGNITNTLDITSSFPASHVIVGAKMASHIKADNAGTLGAAAISSGTVYKNEHASWGGPKDPVTGLSEDVIQALSMEINGSRYNNATPVTQAGCLSTQYYKSIGASRAGLTKWGVGKDNECYDSPELFTYPIVFAERPMVDPLQVTSFLNFARADKVVLKFLINSNVYADLSGEGGENLTNNSVTVHVFYWHYNIFRYVYGLGGLAMSLPTATS